MVPAAPAAIDATPASTLALLDGVPLPSLPFSGNFPTSGALHSLEVSAKGYETVRRFVSFERNQEIIPPGRTPSRT